MQEKTAVRMLNLREGMSYCGLGRNKFLQFATECQAAKRYGRRNLYDKKILDEALERLPITGCSDR